MPDDSKKFEVKILATGGAEAAGQITKLTPALKEAATATHHTAQETQALRMAASAGKEATWAFQALMRGDYVVAMHEAKFATIGLTTAMRANPFGAVIFGATLAIGAISYFVGGQEKATKATGEFTDALDETATKLGWLDKAEHNIGTAASAAAQQVLLVTSRYKDAVEMAEALQKRQEEIDKAWDRASKARIDADKASGFMAAEDARHESALIDLAARSRDISGRENQAVSTAFTAAAREKSANEELGTAEAAHKSASAGFSEGRQEFAATGVQGISLPWTFRAQADLMKRQDEARAMSPQSVEGVELRRQEIERLDKALTIAKDLHKKYEDFRAAEERLKGAREAAGEAGALAQGSKDEVRKLRASLAPEKEALESATRQEEDAHRKAREDIDEKIRQERAAEEAKSKEGSQIGETVTQRANRIRFEALPPEQQARIQAQDAVASSRGSAGITGELARAVDKAAAALKDGAQGDEMQKLLSLMKDFAEHATLTANEKKRTDARLKEIEDDLKKATDQIKHGTS